MVGIFLGNREEDGMVRTIVSLSEDDKRWLDQYSHNHHQAMAQTIRVAVKLFQKSAVSETKNRILSETAGLLKDKADSVRFVRQLRDEWEE